MIDKTEFFDKIANRSIAVHRYINCHKKDLSAIKKIVGKRSTYLIWFIKVKSKILSKISFLIAIIQTISSFEKRSTDEIIGQHIFRNPNSST